MLIVILIVLIVAIGGGAYYMGRVSVITVPEPLTSFWD
jgi:hypothetical protein